MPSFDSPRAQPDNPRVVDKLSQSEDQRQALQEAAGILRRGGLVVMPTETVYGIAAAVEPAEAVQRLRRLKQRKDDQAFTVHLASPSAASRYVNLDKRPLLRRLVQRTMPGPITIRVDIDDDEIARCGQALGLSESAWPRVWSNNILGLRCPDHSLAAELLSTVDVPVVATSANQPGRPPASDADAAAAAVGDDVDLVLDGGRCRIAQGSTIVHVHDNRFDLVREGMLDERYLRKIARRLILFVCSGNTCRSPMAAALARQAIAEHYNTTVDKLSEQNIQVASAGVYASLGSPATPEAVAAADELGADASTHRSQPVTAELIEDAEVIYCMTRMHREAILQVFPHVKDKVVLLDEAGDIDDPIGGGSQVYLRAAERIRDAVGKRLEALPL
jgi:protein-tyrosine phosphatase